MNTASFLARTARIFADRPALSLGTEVVADYGSFAGRVGALAGGLRAGLGLAPGDRVGLAMANHPEFMVVLFACWHAGLVAVPMNAKLHRREFAFMLSNSGARACFVTPAMEDTVGGLEAEIEDLEQVVSIAGQEYAPLFAGAALELAEVAPDDPAWLFYTSGTTGRPKGATLSHRNLLAQTMNYFADIDTVSERDAIIHAAPMSHASGMYGLPHVAKGANQITPESGGFDAAETFDLIARWPGATFFMAPTMIVRLLASPALEGADLTNLKTIVYGGGPMYVEDTLRAIERLGQKLVQIYGQAEAPMTITGLSRARHRDTAHPRYRERLASVGLTRTDVEVKVFDEDDNELAPGEIGEVVVRGDVMMTGYWQDPEATAKTLRGGWVHTGDIGCFDEDGFLTLKDRSKDMIISGGTNIYPREIEEILIRHPGVLEASVVGQPDREWGENVVAFVVPRAGHEIDEGELETLCLDNIGRFKRPKAYRFVESLPKNNYGKVLKTELRKRLAEEREEA